VSGTNYIGIFASNAAGTDLTISAAAVSGGTYGISASNNGTGALSVTATGDVTGAKYSGIFASNTAGTDLTVSAAAVSGGIYGISATNFGTGALSVTTTGDVTGTSGSGIDADNNTSGTDLTISAAAVSGGTYGIKARNDGSGVLSVTATGTVTGTSDDGIFARNDTNGTDLTVSAEAVSGYYNGIFARNFGSGALSVTATGDVTGTSGSGIEADNNTNGTDLTVSAATVSGAYDGIKARNFGTGALSVTATGAVTGTSANGIYAHNNYGTDATVSAAAVSGGLYGISARNNGTGALSVTSTGDVSGTNYTGIRAINRNVNGTDLTVSAAAVSGATDGISAVNYGTGALSVTATGAVTGTSGYGIFAFNRTAAGTDLTVSAAAVSGGGYGINARNDGTGALSVTATGDVTGAKYSGISASNNGTDLTVSAASVSGGSYGIRALNFGTGALSVTSTGDVTGTNDDGIYALNSNAAGTDLTISAAAVSGGTYGIKARNYGTGALSVIVSGAVAGGSGAGIVTDTSAGGAVALHLLSASGVTATSGAAIVDGVGDAVVTIDAGAVVTGSIALGDGNDTLNIASGTSLAGVSALNGGSGVFIDTLNLNTGWSGALGDWELMNINTSGGNFALSGIISGTGALTKQGAGTLLVSGTNTLTGATTVTAGRLNVTGSLALSAVTVGTGASLGGTGTVGALTAQSGSTVSPGNSIGTLTVNGNLILAAGSTLAMEVSPTGADLITATGTASIAGNLVVTPVGGTYFAQSYTLVSASALTGTFAATTLGSFGTAFRPTLLYTGTSVILRLDPNSLVIVGGGTLSGNALAVATSFDAAVTDGYNPQPFFNLYTQGDNLNAALGQFSGELHSAERRVALQDTRVVREAALDRLNADLAAGAGTASVTRENAGKSTSIWMRVAGAWSTAKADGIGSRFKTDQTGFLIGADIANGGFRFGGMFNYTSTDLDLADLGQSKVESTGAALYAGYRQDSSGFAVGVGAALASNTAKGNRSITIPDLAQTLRSKVDGTTYQIFGEASYDLAKAKNTRIEPFVQIAYAALDSKALAETGGIAALSGGKQSNDLTTATLGLRGAYVTGKATLSGSAGWQRTGGDRSAPTLLEMSGVNTPYEVRSVALDRDAVAIQTQASFSLSSRLTMGVGYSGVIGRKNSDHGARATVRYAF
jgi:outer membrane autotransporter protein